MFTLALIFFVLSSIASVLGFTGIAPGTERFAKPLFWVFLVLFLIFLLLELLVGWGVL